MNQKPGMSPNALVTGCVIVLVTVAIWGICMVVWLTR